MADGIKIGSLDISAFKVGSSDCRIYLGDTLLYPTATPAPKWLATYQDSHTESAACDASSAITQNEINLTNLVSVEIGNCADTIGKNAFYNCRSLTSCTIGSGVTSIGLGAFNQCQKFTSITINATTPPTLVPPPSPFFPYSQFSATNNCPIYVPSGSVNAYKTADGWSNYASRIQAIPNS